MNTLLVVLLMLLDKINLQVKTTKHCRLIVD